MLTITLPTGITFYLIEAELLKRQVFLAISKGVLAFWAEVLKIGFAIGKHIALDDTSIAKARGLTATGTCDIGLRDGGTSGSKNIFLHVRLLSFCSVYFDTIGQ